MGQEGFEAALGDGGALSTDEAVALGLEQADIALGAIPLG
jgi:hypothetical protein